MTTGAPIESAAERYDTALRRAHDARLPPGYPAPRSTAEWPGENVALLEQYRDWLLSGGISPNVVSQLYIPTAGHVLGLNLKPPAQLDLDADLNRVLDYLTAKCLSAEWLDMSRVALNKFRQFLRQQRGQHEVNLRPVGRARYVAGLPGWLVEQLDRYQHLIQSHWRAARLKEQSLRFWCNYTHVWRWLCERYAITSPTDLKRQYLLDYVDYRLKAGYAASTINNALRCFHCFLLYLHEQDVQVPQALLRRMPSLKQPDRLPRFLTDEQVRRLRDDFERRAAQVQSPVQRRDAVLDRAAFYLLWQGGLRLGEVEELRLEDLDVPGRKLMVRQGKGRIDRAVYLTDTVVQALQDYLAVRGQGATDHVFLYRNRPVCKDLIRARIRAAGERTGVQVTPHRLRHTCATQLLNAGCRVTSIQKLLGHRRIDSTLIYARVHDQTVSADYYAAMTRIEKSLNLTTEVADIGEPLPAVKRMELLELVGRLAEPQLGFEMRLDLVAQMRHVLNGKTPQPALATV
jgi:site-specific recombinase XerD